MKTLKNVILIIAVLSFVGCASEKTKSADEKTEKEKVESTEEKSEKAEEVSTDEKTESVEVSSDKPVIDQFLAMLDGTEKAAEKAVQKFAIEKVIANKMIPYGKNPKIDSREGNCCIFSLTDDEDINQYKLCEEDGKITVFDIYWEGIE